ncbi:hypothetical protein [Streptomyces sp. NPDC048057]|uniref:hypothetical protein n=1 Tax=Streptomyces sp. NPDC048057 TaxID=3155628 RepID=UPI0033F836FE
MTPARALHATDFWREMEKVTAGAAMRVDRPKGSRHPRFPDWIYPLDHGYLEGTHGGDVEGVDVWIGTGRVEVTALVVTVDPHRNRAEVQLLLGCTPAEIAAVEDFYHRCPQAALVIPHPTKGRANDDW